MVKISGPGSGQPPQGVGDAPDVERSGGKGFAGALDKTQPATGSAAQTPTAAPTQSPVGRIGQQLENGEITPQEAVDQVVEMVLDDKLGLDASPALRSQVQTVMRDKLESDPVLAEKVKNLSA